MPWDAQNTFTHDSCENSLLNDFGGHRKMLILKNQYKSFSNTPFGSKFNKEKFTTSTILLTKTNNHTSQASKQTCILSKSSDSTIILAVDMVIALPFGSVETSTPTTQKFEDTLSWKLT